jgi:hypothetical protein
MTRAERRCHEHHAGINSLFGANPLILGILARQTRKARILSLGTLVSLRPDPVRIAEEYATADVISRGRLEIGFVKSGGSEMASNNANPVTNIERYWEAIDLITKTLTYQEGPFRWEKHHIARRKHLPRRQPHPAHGRDGDPGGASGDQAGGKQRPGPARWRERGGPGRVSPSGRRPSSRSQQAATTVSWALASIGDTHEEASRVASSAGSQHQPQVGAPVRQVSAWCGARCPAGLSPPWRPPVRRGGRRCG